MPSRRGFIAAGGATILPLFWGSRKVSAQDVDSPTLICLVGVTEETSPNLVDEIARRFISRGMPVSCALDTTGGAGFDSPVGRQIEALATSETGLFEVVAQVHESGEDRRYFHMRRAARLRASLTKGQADDPLHVLGGKIITVFDPAQDEELDHVAYRGARFRVFLRPHLSDQKTRVNSKGREQIEISGGRFVDFTNPSNSLPLSRTDAIGGPIYIPVDVAAGLPLADVVAVIDALAERLQTASREGAIFTTRPSDFLLQKEAYPAPSLSVVLSYGEADGEDGPLAQFAQGLDAANIPYTRISKDALGRCDGDGDCIRLASDPNTDLAGTTQIVVLPPATAEAYWGVRADGRYQIASHGGGDLPAETLLPMDPLADMAIIITAENVSTYIKRAFLINRLQTMRREGRAKLFSLRDMVAHLFAQEPVLDHFHRTRSLLASLPQGRPEVTETARKVLLEDAALAWSFITRWSHSVTGLCAGTVLAGAGGRVNREATLWDVASQMRGIMAAQAIGIIDKADARDRLETMMQHLPTVTIAGAQLPPARFSSSTGRVISADFDVCDMGRFLNALFAAKEGGFIAEETAKKVTGMWDLHRVVQDGKPHDVAKGWFVAKHLSHCTAYLRYGFAQLGLEITSPYVDDFQGSETDQQIRFLYRAASIGHFGTEPALLHEIEIGGDDPTSYLARVLFAAQVKWHEKTGQFKSASETLLDFEPWFSYQGIRFDRKLDESWVVAVTPSASAFRTPEFRARAEVISAKSAFLWAATVPHPYAKNLLTFIREKTKFDGEGFSAGVYTQTQEPMTRYSDVNTNGVILSAIAHMLHS